MAKEYPRSQRVADQLQRELADLIQRSVNDPRVHMVSVTAVEVTRDLAHARVFVTTLDDTHRSEVVEALNHAAGFLRRELGHRLRLRTVPQLSFKYDESIEHGLYMDRLIDSVQPAPDSEDNGEE